MKQRVRSDLAFLDMVFNMVLAFALLFVMSFLLIRPPAETKKAVEMKAEFVITLSWPDGALDDQDLWVLMPNGQQVGYAAAGVVDQRSPQVTEGDILAGDSLDHVGAGDEHVAGLVDHDDEVGDRR